MKLEDQKTTAYQPPMPGGSGSRVNWLSAFVGLAVGLVLASVAWVQVLPANPTGGSDQAGDLVFVPGDEGAGGAGGATGTGGRRIIRKGGGGTSGTEGTTGGAGEGQSGVGGGGGGGGVNQGGGGGKVPPGGLIKLGATVAEDGIAKDFLGEVRYGMDAVKARVNAAGGIKGTDRQLQIVYKQDSWDPTRGQGFIDNLINEENVFALAVSPSSEGLNAASGAGLFNCKGRSNCAKVPVVGADGLNNTQFLDEMIWPVAAATTTQAHVMIKDAWERSGSTKSNVKLHPAIVFGNTYRFGVEGANAFGQAYKRVSGKNIPGFVAGGTSCKSSPPEAGRFCGINAGNQTFTSEIAAVRKACLAKSGLPACNFILLLLEPSTALTWMGDFDPASKFPYGMAGAQPLFTSNFAVECRTDCNGMRLWTGYNPPIGSYANSPQVADFVRELKAQNSRADESNQFTMGGYVGMSLLVDALERVGKDLTRERLVATLNSMPPLKTGLTNPDGLEWGPLDPGRPGNRYANKAAQAFRIDFVTKFDGWQPATPYTDDPWLGLDNKL